MLKKLQLQDGQPTAISISPSAGHEDGYVSKYNSSTGEFIETAQVHGIHNEEKIASITDIQIRSRRQSTLSTS